MTQFSVLFVDDEPLTRKVTARLLGRHYPVLEADGGESCLKVLEEKHHQIGVVVTDMKMGEMDGMTLIHEIVGRFPGIPIIASSGDLSEYEFDQMISQGDLYASLEKPWEFDHALEIIKNAISTRSE